MQVMETFGLPRTCRYKFLHAFLMNMLWVRAGSDPSGLWNIFQIVAPFFDFKTCNEVGSFDDEMHCAFSNILEVALTSDVLGCVGTTCSVDFFLMLSFLNFLVYLQCTQSTLWFKFLRMLALHKREATLQSV